MTGSKPFLGETHDRRSALPGIASLELTVRQDPWGHHTDGGSGRESRYTLGDLPRHLGCVNPRCQQGGLDLQQVALFWPEGERSAPCNGHEGSPAGRRQGDPCDNTFLVELRKTLEG